MSWSTGPWPELGVVAAEAALVHLTALVGLGIGQRRTLAQLTIIDVAAAVAVGAIIGRTAIAADRSCATAAVALITSIVVHRAAGPARFDPVLGEVFDHGVFDPASVRHVLSKTEGGTNTTPTHRQPGPRVKD